MWSYQSFSWPQLIRCGGTSIFCSLQPGSAFGAISRNRFSLNVSGVISFPAFNAVGIIPPFGVQIRWVVPVLQWEFRWLFERWCPLNCLAGFALAANDVRPGLGWSWCSWPGAAAVPVSSLIREGWFWSLSRWSSGVRTHPGQRVSQIRDRVLYIWCNPVCCFQQLVQ